MTFEDEVVETAVRTLGALLNTRSLSASQLPLMDTDGHLNYHCHRSTDGQSRERRGLTKMPPAPGALTHPRHWKKSINDKCSDDYALCDAL